MTLCVEACKKLLDLWAKIARVEHGVMRVMGDSEGAITQVVNGQDHKRSATYKRSQFYVEHVASQGMVKFDAAPGTVNPADVFTKQVRNRDEFNGKIEVATGIKPLLFKSAAVVKNKGGSPFHAASGVSGVDTGEYPELSKRKAQGACLKRRDM